MSPKRLLNLLSEDYQLPDAWGLATRIQGHRHRRPGKWAQS